MLKRKVTILLIGLMCFSSVSGFFTVICYGSDGHVAVESAGHNHCECDENEGQERAAVRLIESADHDHCMDAIAISNITASTQKNIKLSTYKVFRATLFLQTVSTHTASGRGYSIATSDALSSFFTPLETVILLA